MISSLTLSILSTGINAGIPALEIVTSLVGWAFTVALAFTCKRQKM
jgi:hypothetical protein